MLLDVPDRRLRQRAVASIDHQRNRVPKPRQILRPKQGVIQQAVYAVLAGSSKPLRARAVQAAIETSLARSVSINTVASCLGVNAKNPGSPVVRVADGLYVRRE
jgi:hypothetical protein